jgi:hypothetical protein
MERGSKEDGEEIDVLHNVRFFRVRAWDLPESFPCRSSLPSISLATTGDCSHRPFFWDESSAVTRDAPSNHARADRAGKPAATRMKIPASIPRHL